MHTKWLTKLVLVIRKIEGVTPLDFQQKQIFIHARKKAQIKREIYTI